MGITNYFPGVGITFTKTGDLGYIITNSGTNIAYATNAIYAQYATNWVGWATNWTAILGLGVTYNTVTATLGGAPVVLELASGDFVGQGGANRFLKGTGVNPTWSQVDLGTADVTGSLPNASLANDSVTYNGVTVALGASDTLDLASIDFANQGHTTNVLHGGGAGNPSWAQVNLATDVTGTLSTNSIVPGATNTVLSTFNPASGAVWSGVPSITNLNLAATLGANNGVINQNGANLLSTYGTGNLFIGTKGEPAGNFTGTGGYNIGLGRLCLSALTNGIGNVGIGSLALNYCQGGSRNFALGQSALLFNVIGNDNVAVGASALANVTRHSNVGIGFQALGQATPSYFNTAIGYSAGYLITSGTGNAFLGYQAGSVAGQKVNAVNSVAIGYQSFTTENYQIVLGNTDTVETKIFGTTTYVECVTNVMTSTDGYPTTTTNVPAVFTPVGLFGYMGWYGTATLDFVGSTTYTNVWLASSITPSRVLTNGFGYNSSLILLTNYIAGYYSVKFGATFIGNGQSLNDDYEAEVFITPSGGSDIGEECLSSHASGAANGNHYSIDGAGRIYLAAGSRIQLKMKSNATDDADIIRAYLDVGP